MTYLECTCGAKFTGDSISNMLQTFGQHLNEEHPGWKERGIEAVQQAREDAVSYLPRLVGDDLDG